MDGKVDGMPPTAEGMRGTMYTLENATKIDRVGLCYLKGIYPVHKAKRRPRKNPIVM